MDDERTTNPNKTVVTVIAPSPKREDSQHGCLVVIYGQDLGRRVGLGENPCIIGRSSKCDVHIEQESVSRNHAKVFREGTSYRARDLGSTNGTYVNDSIISGDKELRDGDQLKVGRTIFKFMLGSNMEAQYHEEIYRLMTVDGLTELHNKRYFDEAIDREMSRSRRYGRAFGLVLFDIDHFKKINDTYGHLAGDAVLRQLGGVVKQALRRDDIACRTGGEEFSIILPETGLQQSVHAAEKLRRTIETTQYKFEETIIPVTVSMGCAQWEGGVEDPTELVKKADEKLYEAKRGGRNQVRF